MQKIIISRISAFVFFLLFVVAFFSIGVESVQAEDVLKKFVCPSSAENKYYKIFQKENSQSGDFRKSYIALKTQYNDSVNTAFNDAVKDLNKSVYQGDKSAKACTPVVYKQLDNGSLLEFYSSRKNELFLYHCALEYIMNNKVGYSATETVLTFESGISQMNNLEFEIVDEMERTDIALRLSLQMYAEMRQWYPVHRDLECLISEMENYRNALRKFVDRVSIMPAKYYNYASEKQQ